MFFAQVKLKDSLVGTLRFSSARDAQLCWLDARVDYSEVVQNFADVLSSKEVTLPNCLLNFFTTLFFLPTNGNSS